MKNSARNFIKILKEICEEEGIDLTSYSCDWIFRLTRNNQNHFIVGYQFGLNTASVHSICCDKSAASEIMSSLGIPNIEHYFFMSPIEQKYINEAGNWSALTKMLEEYGEVVCKPNEGSSGDMVFRVRNQYELEGAVYKIFQSSRSMAVSPYYEIQSEYRAIVLDGAIKLIYSKQRPCIVGDGKRSVKDLVLEHLSMEGRHTDLKLPKKDLTRVLEVGEQLALNWKHNLEQGSKAVMVQEQNITGHVESIVKKVVAGMNVRFASIDIVKCTDGYRVLEINSGVMMEYFSQQDEASYQIAKEIYREAILKMFL